MWKLSFYRNYPSWICLCFIVVAQSPSCVQLFAPTWTEAFQASLPLTISQNLPKLCPLNQWCQITISFPVSSVFSLSQCLGYWRLKNVYPLQLPQMRSQSYKWLLPLSIIPPQGEVLTSESPCVWQAECPVCPQQK